MAAYPELLTEGQPRVPDNFSIDALRDLERNLVFLLEKNYQAITGIGQQLTGLKNWIRENSLRTEIMGMVEELLKNPKVRDTKTIHDLERLLPFEYMVDFLPEILSELKRRGLVSIGPGEKLRWFL